MIRLTLFACALFILPVLAQQRPAEPAMLRIGTFDQRAVAIAYYRSTLHNDFLKAKTAEYQAAKAAKDAKRADLIKKEFEADQDMAHRQTFGTGPYDSLGAQLKPILPAAAKAAGVEAIVPSALLTTDRLQAVDVTEALLEQLAADEKTRKIIGEMREKIRSGEYDPMKYTGEGAH